MIKRLEQSLRQAARFWSARGLPPLWIGRSSRKGLRNSLTTLPIVFALALFAGCAAQPDKTAQPAYTPLSKRKITAVAMTNTPPNSVQPGQTLPTPQQGQAPATPPPKARVVPLTARIASVNKKFRFVIVDFTNSRQPAIDEKLGVYRVGEKVAEIKISGPYRDTTVAADIISGEVKYGDEVKTD